MVESASAKAPPASRAGDGADAGGLSLGRAASFRVIYAAFFAFAVVYVASVQISQTLLAEHFRGAVAEAIRVDPSQGPIAWQIGDRVDALVRSSAWTRFWGVEVHVFVQGADGRVLYSAERRGPPELPAEPPDAEVLDALREAMLVLPARAGVVVNVPLGSLLSMGLFVGYGAVLITGLFFYYLRVTRREEALVASVVEARDATAARARSIEQELGRVRERLREVEPAERAHAEEIRALDEERQALQSKLADLAEREAELRATAARPTDLDQERQALEDLLEEAVDDLSHKESEITALQDRLRRAGRSEGRGSRTRDAEQLGRRLRTLYKTLEIEDRAVQDIVALRDETMKLRAEEGIKRLADDPETAAIRRKVGGLPPQISVYELGFAGKGRIYYTRGRQRRYRVLAIGAKNTQKTDLEYLSRLPTE